MCVRQLVNEYQIQSSTSVKFLIAQNVNMEYVTVEVLSVPVRIFTRVQFPTRFLELLQNHKRDWISYANVHIFDIAQASD